MFFEKEILHLVWLDILIKITFTEIMVVYMNGRQYKLVNTLQGLRGLSMISNFRDLKGTSNDDDSVN